MIHVKFANHKKLAYKWVLGTCDLLKVNLVSLKEYKPMNTNEKFHKNITIAFIFKDC